MKGQVYFSRRRFKKEISLESSSQNEKCKCRIHKPRLVSGYVIFYSLICSLLDKCSLEMYRHWKSKVTHHGISTCITCCIYVWSSCLVWKRKLLERRTESSWLIIKISFHWAPQNFHAISRLFRIIFVRYGNWFSRLEQIENAPKISRPSEGEN